MKKIFQPIKAFFRRMAIYVVTAYANRIYKKAVIAAEKRHEEEKEMIYVSNGTIDAKSLVTYNRKQFRKAKRLIGIYDNKHYNIEALKKAAWYHTANREGKDELSDKAKELRRLAFVKHLLQQAKLV
jgi:hypothetical protein